MEREITALVPRGPQTAALPVPRGTLVHPSFPNALPAIIAAPVEVSYCRTCAYLAQEIRAADARGDEARRLDYGLLGLRHWHASHGGPS